MKEQHVDDLYEHFDVDFYEKARLMVSLAAIYQLLAYRLTFAVSSMDRPPRPKRHSDLRLRDKGPGQQDCARVSETIS